MSAPTRSGTAAQGGQAQADQAQADETQADPTRAVSKEDETNQAIRDVAARVAAAGESSPRPGPHPVNRPMIDHWLTALDSSRPNAESSANDSSADESSASETHHGEGAVAPPAMIQVWTMPGLRGQRGDDDPLLAMMGVLDQAGYTSIVATNCEQTYHRYLREGERVSVTARLTEVTGPKRTALGQGWFVTTHSTWYVAGEPVAEMLFRVLKFRPPSAAAGEPPRVAAAEPPSAAVAEPTSAPASEPPSASAPTPAAGNPLRPVVSRDTEFFWAGTAARELRIQRCEDCGALRHPPGPRCTACGSSRRGHLLAAGTGTIFSYVVHHHPPVSGRTVPFVVVLVELPEGVRMLGELVGIDPLDPEDAATIRIGSPVHLAWQQVDDGLTLPVWRIGTGESIESSGAGE